MVSNDAYLQVQFARVLKNYKPKHLPFGGKQEFAKWYVAKLTEQDCKCYYCDTSVHDLNKLIDAGKLRARSVKGDGKRGPVLEIDKQGDIYHPASCVLACYYCNNDKSYITSGDDYKKYFGENRKKYFEELLDQLK